nr:uncharacterized protein LOC111839574 isoform X2 [Paramormyrops kingsleyae]
MSEADRIRFLQDQNKDVQQSLLRTSLRMERMGAEFKNNYQQLEAELQRTRMELTSLQDKFERQQDNYSSTQQANNLLEHKLCSVVQDMDGERKRLNQRISELTEELSIAKSTIQTLENINLRTPPSVPSVLQEALKKHLQAEEAATRFLPHVAPPPAQFMDSEHFNKPSLTGDAQSLGAVPEEEDSDWSEATEVWLCGPKGSNKGHYGLTAWKKDQWAEGGMESESGGKEAVSRPPPCSVQIPHLQLTVHPETPPASITEINFAQFKGFPERPAGGSTGSAGAGKLGSPIRILSASLEEIHSTSTQL